MELTDIQVKNLISNILEGHENNAGILYHKAPVSVRKSILKNGLIPSVGYSYKAHWDDQDGLKPYVFLYDYNEFGEYDSTYDDDIYAVDTKQLDKTHLNPDPDIHMKGCFVYDKLIPTTAIKLVYKGSSKDSDDLSRHADIYRFNVLNEGKNYVNMGVDVREGGRHAVKMTVDEFKQEMIHAYHMYAMEQESNYKYDLQLTPSPDNFVYKLAYKNRKNEDSKYAAKLYKDIWGSKYKFDSENVDAFGGIKMSKKGFPYIQCDAGGDWECPVCFFVYFDGTHFRGYVPLKGNAINRNNNTAFQGSGDEEEAKFIAKEMGIEFEEAKSLTGDIKFNEDACLKDFLSRIEVKGTYKKRDFTKDEEIFKEYRKKRIDDYNREKEEREKERQMKQEETNMEPDSEINEMVNNILNKFVFEATAGACAGSSVGAIDFDVPFPGDDETLDRTPGFSMGKRVGKSNVGEGKKRKKVVKNDKGEVVPEFCKKCGGKVGLYICGEPIYKCSKCGKYYGTMPFTLGRKKK